VASACGQSLLKAPTTVYRSVTRTPNKHVLSNWIQLVIDAGAVEKDTGNAVFGVWFSCVCAVEGFRKMSEAKSTCIIWHQWRTEGGLGGFKPPPPRNSEGPTKSCQTQPDCENCLKLLNLGCQHPKMFGKKVVKF